MTGRGLDHSCPLCGEGCDCGNVRSGDSVITRQTCLYCSACRRRRHEESLRESARVGPSGMDGLSSRVRAELERAMRDDASLYHLVMKLRLTTRDQALDVAVQTAIGLARGLKAVSSDLVDALSRSPGRPILIDVDADRLAQQAREVSTTLAEAGVGAMPIAEGVRRLVAERDKLKGSDV